MSETIKTVFLNYVTCALVGGVLEYIAPEKTRKVLRIAVVSVLLLGIISPIVKSDISVDDLLPKTEIKENADYDTLMHTANLTEKKIRDEMKEILINEGVNEYEIYVSTSVDAEENTVYLEEIKIEVGNVFADEIEIIKDSVPDEYRQILKVGVKNE
ncbi:MAG: hypothetical protein ACI4VW_08425 [Acutalibacteraceae bacterium]